MKRIKYLDKWKRLFHHSHGKARKRSSKKNSSIPLEERVKILESILLDIRRPAHTFDVEAFLSSPEGNAEFKSACRRFAIFNDRKPLEEFAKKTGGKMPKGDNHE